jgi:hypothetical protein
MRERLHDIVSPAIGVKGMIRIGPASNGTAEYGATTPLASAADKFVIAQIISSVDVQDIEGRKRYQSGNGSGIFEPI